MTGVSNLQSVPVPDAMEPQPAAPVPDVMEPQPQPQPAAPDSLFRRALKKLVPSGSRGHSGAYRFTSSPENILYLIFTWQYINAVLIPSESLDIVVFLVMVQRFTFNLKAVKIFGCKCDLCTGIDL
ncbi:hypothetical protein F0562_014639 [Nyssa sinensis]|uniref:Uncharacterized protein n=1 Tax=Nyssa sinensis TaxID=561372 RepID=A0A5J4ZNB9_9ASTE|nr:hypothetical protein F0562_014639 [Nyssa sinensis]